MTYMTPAPRKSRAPMIAAIVGGTFVLLCLIGTIGAIFTPEPKSAQPAAIVPSVESAPTAVGSPSADAPTPPGEPTPAPPKPEPAAKPTIEDGLYHVGEDVAPGTYRLAEPVTGADFCYWKKSKDAEGENIIDNDLASTGRLQVTIKRGQWFETSRCGTWVKK